MPEKICCEEFEDVFEAIRSGRADAGVLPLENSTTGSISATYDLLLRYGFYIKGEQTVSISHCLLGIPGATPETIKPYILTARDLNRAGDFFRLIRPGG